MRKWSELTLGWIVQALLVLGLVRLGLGVEWALLAVLVLTAVLLSLACLVRKQS